ncbi:MFS transporter [Flindersiella endophytica]
MSIATTSPRTGYASVVTIAVGIFSIVTTEILPIGLLSPIARTFDISKGTAGIMMTIPGLVAAVAAPVFTVATARLDRRTMLAVLMVGLAVSDLLAALAPTYEVMLFARVLVGCVIGGFWSIGSGLSARLVPERSVGLATAVIFSAVPLGSVLGVPAGTLIGHVAGWRTAFVVMTVFTAGCLVALLCSVPPLPAERPASLQAIRGLLGQPIIRRGLVVTVLVVVAHFGTYTYVTPLLQQVGRVDDDRISAFLLVYGVAGTAGNFLAGLTISRRLRATFAVSATLIALATLLSTVMESNAALVFLVIWGLAYGAVPVCSGAWFAAAAPEAREAATILFVSSFQASLSAGALLGGLVVDHTTLRTTVLLGGTLALLATVVLTAPPRRRRSGFAETRR